MKFTEMGKEDGKTLVMLPGTACTWQINFHRVIERLAEQYHLICVNYDGFDDEKDTKPFTDMLTVTEKIEDYILENHGGHVDGAYGSSLGGSFVGLLIQRKRIHIDHGFIGSSDLDQGSPVIARIMTSIVGRWIADAGKNEKKQKQLKDMLVKNFGMEMDEETDSFMNQFTESITSLHPETVTREFYSDYVTPLKDDIRVDGTIVHIIYALKMGKKYEKRYLQHFYRPDILRFDMQHEAWLFQKAWTEPVLAKIAECMEKDTGNTQNSKELKFGDIQETALIPLAIKASETARPDARIRDEKAKEIIDTLGVDVSKYDPFLSHEGVVARTIMFREALKDLLKEYPDAVCINLGCGFDDKFSQVDNGRLQWFDVDLPDQIAVRRKVYEDRERCTMMDGNALDGAWTASIPKADMTIVVMEGVLEYFSKEQVKTCLNMLCDSFPHGYLLAELHSPFLEKNSKHHDAVKHTNATFGWGTKSGLEYLELEPRMSLVSEHSYNEEMKKYTIRGKLFAIVGKNMNNRLAVFRW